ncbi:MAG TPA: periplasmic heavy metal sensor [Caulobacteraceae bacterium]|nr:periplasmic heavy metal sensor [Caulobacteraceae bacterium]
MKRAVWLNLLVTLVVAAAAGFIGAWAGSEGVHRGREQTSLLRQSVHEMVHQGLKITPAQRKEINDIETRYTKRRNDLRVQISQTNVELAAAMSEEMAFGPQAQTAIDHLQHSVGDLQSSTVLYVLEIRDVLTPEQRMIYDQKVVEALTNGVL